MADPISISPISTDAAPIRLTPQPMHYVLSVLVSSAEDGSPTPIGASELVEMIRQVVREELDRAQEVQG